MAQIVTITNPLTGQPAQVDQLEHTAQQIDDSIGRALPGGEIDTLLDGKAPAGYGLGKATTVYISDANTATEAGWYYWGKGAVNTPGNYGAMLVIPRHSTITTQLASLDEGGFAASKICVRKQIDGVWGEWEWVNPPMVVGTEYRTTERYLGKPVYVKVVNFGNYPASGTKTVAHKISNVRNIVSCLGTSSLGYSVNGYLYVSTFYADKTNISITVTADVSNNEVKVMLKYTKTTD